MGWPFCIDTSLAVILLLLRLQVAPFIGHLPHGEIHQRDDPYCGQQMQKIAVTRRNRNTSLADGRSRDKECECVGFVCVCVCVLRDRCSIAWMCSDQLIGPLLVKHSEKHDRDPGIRVCAFVGTLLSMLSSAVHGCPWTASSLRETRAYTGQMLPSFQVLYCIQAALVLKKAARACMDC
eukprot:2551263-Amphidinium_carterae.1